MSDSNRDTDAELLTKERLPSYFEISNIDSRDSIQVRHNNLKTNEITQIRNEVVSILEKEFPRLFVTKELAKLSLKVYVFNDEINYNECGNLFNEEKDHIIKGEFGDKIIVYKFSETDSSLNSDQKIPHHIWKYAYEQLMKDIGNEREKREISEEDSDNTQPQPDNNKEEEKTNTISAEKGTGIKDEGVKAVAPTEPAQTEEQPSSFFGSLFSILMKPFSLIASFFGGFFSWLFGFNEEKIDESISQTDAGCEGESSSCDYDVTKDE
ncbi:MAG: hypothetical protein ACEY3B_04565 [Wolbachia sp.]